MRSSALDATPESSSTSASASSLQLVLGHVAIPMRWWVLERHTSDLTIRAACSELSVFAFPAWACLSWFFPEYHSICLHLLKSSPPSPSGLPQQCPDLPI